MDPQGNATMGCGVDKDAVKATAYDVLLGEKSLAEGMVSAGKGAWLIAVSPQPQIVAQRPPCGRDPQRIERDGVDLADALPAQAHATADLAQAASLPVGPAEVQAHHASLVRRQSVEQRF